MRFSLLFLLPWLFLSAAAQQDSVCVLSPEEFFGIVKQNHPVSFQAGIQIEKADAALMSARGAFDPQINADFSQKDLKDTRYYQQFHGSLKVPTWFGAEIATGFDNNEGVFLNPELSTPDPGLWFAGILVPVGAGLLMDKRRAALRQAQVYQQSSQADAAAILNNLMLEAGDAYWRWFTAYEILIIQREAVELARLRYEGVKASALAGDVPFIDTVEAGIQYQNRLLNEQQALLDLQNAGQLLSVYLWADGRVPLELQNCAVPVDFDEVQTAGVPEIRLDSLIEAHPELLQTGFKIDQLDIERRLKQEKLRPTVGLKYQALNSRQANGVLSEFDVADRVFGLEFKMPILLRAARGDVAAANLKILETELEFDNKRQVLNFKANKFLNDLNTTEDQITLFTRTVQDYAALLEGERTKFEVGESSLFLVNAREVGLIQSRVKLVQLVSKNQMSQVRLQHALGILGGPLR